MATSQPTAEHQFPTVSVIVPHYNDLVRLERCLTALEHQIYPREKLEIIVADNGSPQGREVVAEVVGSRGQLVVVDERGAGLARNGGVAVSTGVVLAFTDSDCLPDAHWVAEGVAALLTTDVVGGRVDVSINEAGRATAAEAFELEFAFDNESYIKRKGFTVTANLFCRRALFDDIGGFRVGVSEDLEWSRRATAAGYKLAYAPAATVSHPARRSWQELVGKWKRINSETYSLSSARRGRVLAWLLRSSLLPVSAVAHTPRVLLSRRIPRRRDRAAALGVLYALRLWRMTDALRLVRRSGAK